MASELVVTALRVILCALFIFSGLVKISGLRGFSIIVASYSVLPRKLVKPLAYSQPFIETFIGLWLSSDWQLRWSALASLAMLIVATLFVLAGLVQKKRMENCGCYGAIIKVPLTWKKLAENIVWIALAASLVWVTWA